MLKKISVQQVRIGMFIQSLEGSWLAHSFWKTKFLLQEQADLAALLSSGVPMLVIDTERGLDVSEASAAIAAVQALEPTDPPKPKPSPPLSERAPTSMAAEMARANILVNRSREAVTSMFGEARLGKALDADQCLPIVEEISNSVSRNPSALISLARLKTKDNYTYMHSVAVCALMVALAKQLGLSDEQTREAGLAGLLHDIGKMAMPLDVLNKPGKLSDAEFNVIRSHPLRGYQMLKQGASVPAGALDVCLHHHEKMDGSGYPQKLKGEQISLLARMGAVCDVYDAITSTRPYKSAWDPAGSIQRMAQWAGDHFDPVVFKAFVKSVGIYPVGSLVKLESGRLAVVTELNPASLAAPVVRVFYSTRSSIPIPVLTLDLSHLSTRDKVVSRETPSDWGFTYLEDIWQQPSSN
ncbi:HD-GYP domain-containing protein [Paucibacter sp. B2R-40]|uniref:HD-GYP domain-containing protein n=1 Tax=Paucibacter sp. B2R-40 TaxID=2893554 RepID=UPI0021E3F467|nr:HD-GYP domain-containing protein [Paucibacter sp. B2R-40]MCV2356869.1 HD-GYP domain-containing protein [Paucibacter sp. B2R-40]